MSSSPSSSALRLLNTSSMSLHVSPSLTHPSPGCLSKLDTQLSIPSSSSSSRCITAFSGDSLGCTCGLACSEKVEESVEALSSNKSKSSWGCFLLIVPILVLLGLSLPTPDMRFGTLSRWSVRALTGGESYPDELPLIELALATLSCESSLTVLIRVGDSLTPPTQEFFFSTFGDFFVVFGDAFPWGACTRRGFGCWSTIDRSLLYVSGTECSSFDLCRKTGLFISREVILVVTSSTEVR